MLKICTVLAAFVALSSPAFSVTYTYIGGDLSPVFPSVITGGRLEGTITFPDFLRPDARTELDFLDVGTYSFRFSDGKHTYDSSVQYSLGETYFVFVTDLLSNIIAWDFRIQDYPNSYIGWTTARSDSDGIDTVVETFRNATNTRQGAIGTWSVVPLPAGAVLLLSGLGLVGLLRRQSGLKPRSL